MTRKPRVFISYSRKDGEAFAIKLRTRLEEEDIPLWQDRVGMEGGRDWWLQIVEALDNVEFMALVMTPKAMESEIIRKEWRYARQKGVCVYPVKGVQNSKLDYSILPRWMRSAQFYDLKYEWQKFVNDLNTRCQEPRVPFMVEDLPKSFVSRPKEFNALMEQLLDIEREEPLAITTALRGTGGYGKTTLARALCHEESVQEAYDDGILWVTLGENPGDLTAKINDLIKILDNESPVFSDINAASTRLSELLADRDILIVIDDAWDIAHVKPFLQGGPRCSRLITTRNSDTLPPRTRHNILDAMQDDEARSLLGFELPDEEKDELQNLADRIGNWPLLLGILNAFLFDRVVNRNQTLSDALAYLKKRLDKYGITAFDACNSENRNQAVDSTLSVSMELLNDEETHRLAELSIFPEDTEIPLETVEKLWAHAGLDELDTEGLCERFFRLSLLQDFDPNPRIVRLHDVIRSYLQKKNRRHLVQMHTRFLDAYNTDKWADLPPTEPYLWNHLAYHLVKSKQTDILQNLLYDYNWLDGKLAVSGVNALLADYDNLPDYEELRLIQGALRLSANQITRNRNQLAPHLFGRLNDYKSLGIRKLLEMASKAQKRIWFCPIHSSLVPPGGALLRTFEGHDDEVNSVAISPNGKTMLSGSEDYTMKLWDLDTGKVLKIFKGHKEGVTSVAISPDGKTALSGSYDNTLKLWDLGTGKLLKTFEGHDNYVNSVAISPDGKTALSGSDDKTLKLWDLGTRKVIKSFEGHSKEVNSVAISPDGKTALSGSDDKSLKLWDLGTGKVLKTLVNHDEWITSVAISPDGKTAVSGFYDGILEFLDLSTGNVLKTFEGHDNKVNSVAITSDGKTALSCSFEHTLKLWDFGTGKLLKTFEGHGKEVNSVAINPDGKTAVSGSEDNTIKLWNLCIVEAQKTFKGHREAIYAVAISPDGKTALSGSFDRTLKLWNLDSGKVLKTLDGHNGWVNFVTVNPYGKTALSGSFDRTLKLWDLNTGKILKILEGHSNEVNSIAISPDGKTALSGSDDKTLKLWDLGTGKVIKSFEGHSKEVNSVAISPDGKTALSGSYDNTLKLWDLGTGKLLKNFEGHDNYVNSVAISPDGKTALSGSGDKSLKLWDLSTGNVLKTFEGHDDWVNSVAISSDGKTALSGSDDKSLKLWDLKTKQVLASFLTETKINSVSISPCRKIALAGEDNGSLHFLLIKDVRCFLRIIQRFRRLWE